MFIASCFIKKNTPELRKKLEELGYKFSGADHIELDCIITLPHRNTFSVFAAYHFNIYDDSFKTVWKEYIDCGTNEELFLALAALRNDSDYMQWFVNKNGYFEMCFNDKVENYLCGYGVRKYRQIDETYHKVTVKEIVEHFNKK